MLKKKKGKIKFALEMKDGVQVRNLDDLREHFDLEKAIGYFIDGKLLTWLNERYYDEEAEALEKLSKDDKQLNKKLCQILGVEYADEEIDLEEIEWRSERIAKLKQYTDDTEIINNVDLVAFDQEELAELLDDDEPVIYLCQNKFIIPLRAKNKKYIGVGKVEVIIKSDTDINLKKFNIKFENIQFKLDHKIISKTPNKVLESKIHQNIFDKIDELLCFYDKVLYEYDTDSDVRYKLTCYVRNLYDYDDIWKALNQIANNEDVNVMNLYGLMYSLGAMNEKNSQKAIYWYEKAANKGLVIAMYNLGYEYCYILKDYTKAIYWYEKASDKGYAAATVKLGNLYYNGKGIEANFSKAIIWYKKAARQGSMKALKALEKIYGY